MSGVYDVHRIEGFKADGTASPMAHVRAKSPPFLITYCQWDYLGLPLQAREFTAAMKKAFHAADLVYIPGESHISEIIHAVKDDDATAQALIKFIQ